MIFHTKRPQYNFWQWSKFIGLRLIFPFILLWDLLKLGINAFVGDALGKLVLLAQQQQFSFDMTTKTLNRTHEKFNHQKHTVVTYDGARLDTLEIKPVSVTHQLPQQRKYMINFMGNGDCYERTINKMQADAEALQCHVVGFNFRRVSRSTGTLSSKNHLVIDGIAQVQRLLDDGVLPENITLNGHSLGGAIASLVAAHFHQQRQRVYLFNDRSFSSITAFVTAHLLDELHPVGLEEPRFITFIRQLPRWSIEPVVKVALLSSHWEINAASAFKSIPDEYKEYIVVRQNRNYIGQHTDDTVIPYSASLHVALKEERRAKKAHLKEPLLSAAKATFQARKMINPTTIEGHNISIDYLKNRHNQTGQTFFTEFVQRRQVSVVAEDDEYVSFMKFIK